MRTDDDVALRITGVGSLRRPKRGILIHQLRNTVINDDAQNSLSTQSATTIDHNVQALAPCGLLTGTFAETSAKQVWNSCFRASVDAVATINGKPGASSARLHLLFSSDALPASTAAVAPWAANDPQRPSHRATANKLSIQHFGLLVQLDRGTLTERETSPRISNSISRVFPASGGNHHPRERR